MMAKKIRMLGLLALASAMAAPLPSALAEAAYLTSLERNGDIVLDVSTDMLAERS